MAETLTKDMPVIAPPPKELVRQPLVLNQRDGYDHSYFFIATFIESHLRFHAGVLGSQA